MLSHWSVNNVVNAINECTEHKAIACSLYSPIPMNSDVVIFYRTSSNSILLMNYFKKQGKKIVYFVDDWLWYPALGEDIHSFKKIFEIVDYVATPNEKLSGKVALLSTVETITIKPGIDSKTLNTMSSHLAENNDVNILVSKGHVSGNYSSTIGLIVKKIRMKIPKKKKITISYFSEKEIFEDKVEGVFYDLKKPIYFDFFYEALSKQRFSMILNPLPEDEFHDCKCPLKFFESASLRIPLITSRVFCFTQKMKDFEDILFASSIDEYVEKIQWVIENKTKADDLSSRSRVTLEKNFLINNNISDFVKKFEENFQVLSEQEQIKKDKKSTPSIVITTETKHLLKIKTSDIVSKPVVHFSHIDVKTYTSLESVSSAVVVGATYGNKLTEQLRYDIFNGKKFIQTGFINACSLLDNENWVLNFSEFKPSSKEITFRIFNLDKKPFSLYLEKSGKNIAIYLS